VAHEGVCLTITQVEGNMHRVDVVEETLLRTRLGKLRPGDPVNLERSLRVNARLDGHIVQGHVDALGICREITDHEGSVLMEFAFPARYRNMLVDKGSITINGVSLTVIRPSEERFRVTVIPYTLEHTTLGQLKTGDEVNLEFDILAKYFARHMEAYTHS
jgi:riboflavin synthase